tara:strand:+ start:275 stop:475 length:201 start_codon:yes stop_codon:yes gene_type:complete
MAELVMAMKERNLVREIPNDNRNVASKKTPLRGKFRVAPERLKAIGKEGFRKMEKLDPADIGNFSE